MRVKSLFAFLFICLDIFIWSVNSVPSRTIPSHMFKDFTLNDKISLEYHYRNGIPAKGKNFHISKNMVNAYLKDIALGKNFYYGKTDGWLRKALRKYSIKDENIVVFGSTLPAYEAFCLHFGAKPVTIEYNKWKTDHPSLICMTPDEYEKEPILFDCGLSISSFEHDGLGRYGDPIDPWGDMKAMRKAKRMIKPNGLLFLAVPVGKDTLVWNSHRIYGKIRLPMLLKGWEVLDCFGVEGFKDPVFNKSTKYYIQPVLVLKNTPS